MKLMDNKQIKQLKSVFKLYSKIKLVYFFGSKAKSADGPLSDYDFAVYIDEKDNNKILDIKLALINQLSRLLKTDNIDIVVLNTAESPELKYNIIKEGRVILEKEPFRVIFEPRFLNEYFDFRFMLLKYNLTKSNI